MDYNIYRVIRLIYDFKSELVEELMTLIIFVFPNTIYEKYIEDSNIKIIFNE
jgi:hypothetical protein